MNIFFASDYHFGHENTFKLFKKADGSPLRPFSSLREMHEVIVDNHNSVVKKGDKIYMVGDIAFDEKMLRILDDMNGEKVLIKGNHDKFKPQRYLQYFKDIRGSHQFDGVIITHIPIHPDSLGRWGKNIHGHLHANRVQSEGKDDQRYYNVSVENIAFTPISLEDIKANVQRV
jgi:calcineurin-like phosphoesterase family protein